MEHLWDLRHCSTVFTWSQRCTLFLPEAKRSRPLRSPRANPVEESSAWPPSLPRLAPGSSPTPTWKERKVWPSPQLPVSFFQSQYPDKIQTCLPKSTNQMVHKCLTICSFIHCMKNLLILISSWSSIFITAFPHRSVQAVCCRLAVHRQLLR